MSISYLCWQLFLFIYLIWRKTNIVSLVLKKGKYHNLFFKLFIWSPIEPHFFLLFVCSLFLLIRFMFHRHMYSGQSPETWEKSDDNPTYYQLSIAVKLICSAFVFIHFIKIEKERLDVQINLLKYHFQTHSPSSAICSHITVHFDLRFSGTYQVNIRGGDIIS